MTKMTQADLPYVGEIPGPKLLSIFQTHYETLAGLEHRWTSIVDAGTKESGIGEISIELIIRNDGIEPILSILEKYGYFNLLGQYMNVVYYAFSPHSRWLVWFLTVRTRIRSIARVFKLCTILMACEFGLAKRNIGTHPQWEEVYIIGYALRLVRFIRRLIQCRQ